MRQDAVTRQERRSRPTPTAYWFWADLAIVHISGDDTDGQFSVVEFLMPPDDETPLHVHRRESQTVYVLEGEVTIWLPGVSRVLRPGECLHQPAGVPQTERVTSAGPARLLDIGSPAGFEKFIAAAGEAMTSPFSTSETATGPS
jgi:mannose-6-phosphate isomerase-like protein (cupin superfamily)